MNILKRILLGFTVLAVLISDAFAQSYEIRGMISENKNAIPFANIIIKETLHGVMSNESGKYIIKGISEGEYTIEISALGYKKLEKKIHLKNNLVIDIELELLKHELQEFVITGVSKATKIKENPLAVSRIGIKNIEQSHESNLMDILQKRSTGVSLLKTGPNISKPFIRGLGYNRVLTLYDGIRQEGQQWGDEHGIEVDGYGMQSIEVIKGPASLMYGSDAIAGVVSFIPQNTDTTLKGIHGKVINEYHHNNNLIGNALYLNKNVKNISYQFGASQRLAKNYRNKVDGRVYNTGFRELNLSGKMLVRYKKSELNLNATYYENVQGIPDGSRDSLSRKFTYQQFEGMEDDIKSRPLVSDEKLNSYAPADLHQQIKHYRIYAKQNIEINKGNLNYTLAWQHNVRKEITHPTDLNQAGLFVKLNTINYSILYQLPETKNSATAIGVNGMWQYNKNDKATDFPIPNYQLFDAGCFIHQTHRMSRYTLSGGIRYDIRQVNVYDLFTLLNTETGFTEQSNQEYNPENYHQYQAFEKSFHGLSGSVGISYQVDDHFYLKANFSRGYRAPSITEIASNGLDPGARIVYLGNKNFKAEFSNQQDLGAFWENKNFDASMSIFNNYIENYIYLAQLADNNNIAITDAQGNRTFQYQQAKAQLYGFESSFNIHPINWKGFSIHQSFQMVRGLNRSNQYKNSGINGEFLPFIPPAQWACELAQKLPLPNTKIKNLIPKVAFEYFADQARYMALYGTETYTPAYFLISASLHLELYEKGNKQLNFFVFANNIADVVYQSNMSRLKYFEYFNDTRPNSSGIYNMGRNIGAKLVYNF